jgi:hypothetical protein
VRAPEREVSNANEGNTQTHGNKQKQIAAHDVGFFASFDLAGKRERAGAAGVRETY